MRQSVANGKILHQPSAIAICSRSYLVPPILVPYKVGVLSEMAIPQRDMVATVANPTVGVAIHEGLV